MRDLIYICAFLAVLTVGAISIAYLEGGIDERLKETTDINAAILEQREAAETWKGKYQTLVDETDAGTFLAAESRYEEARR